MVPGCINHIKMSYKYQHSIVSKILKNDINLGPRNSIYSIIKTVTSTKRSIWNNAILAV